MYFKYKECSIIKTTSLTNQQITEALIPANFTIEEVVILNNTAIKCRIGLKCHIYFLLIICSNINVQRTRDNAAPM
jgi:hypothetical protein